MNTKIEKIKGFRYFLLKQIEGLSTQQLNEIPAGFNNNIIWNLGHLICVQQNLCYDKADLQIAVKDKYFTPYMPGTRPESFAEEQEIRNIKELFITSIDRLMNDFDKIIFENYSPSIAIKKVYGFEIDNIDRALEYLLHHEGLHAGYIFAIKHFL